MTETQGCGATPSPIPPNAKAGANSLFLPCLWFGGEAFAARADAVGGLVGVHPAAKGHSRLLGDPW